ncbi:MAG: bifunctional UDP-sugar hydrolase/5'-nucleotidase [Corynebacterium sp.]|uniref:bifunctional metallophosphatase/5'-nucleotidase n=1 Tax=Corynebacterium sp. TaxID=1720 RepID=UPI0026DF92DB|nr:bifunctional UDP-sugar hydrolase/5'-nucleotidase [Corynebacterium sp.]MDO5670300.1 bifunctional UDP-sugar hydrolase/5'-nucleotidase [Corynebacterium sp.]
MSLRRFGRYLAATTTTALAFTLAPAVTAQDTTVEFSVSNITDFHGRLEYNERNKEMGAALLTGLNNQINGEENVFTTSGDNVGGSAFVSAITDDEYTLQFLNEAGVGASAVGNHEFDAGQDDLMNRIVPKSDYPILGANVYKADGTHLLPPSTVIEKNGVKIGFVGSVATSTVQKVSPSAVSGLDFRDPVAETNTEAQRLKDSGEADVVIALFHEDAQTFAPEFNAEYVDFLFGGDTHQQYANDSAPVPFAQSLEYGKVLTDVDFTFNTTTKTIEDITITQYDLAAAEAAGATADPAVAAIVAEAKAQADVIGAEIIATIDNSFYRGSNVDAAPGSNRGVESTLNHLIAEAQRDSLSKLIEQDIAIGFMNAGGVRADLPAGEVTYADVVTIQPFGNEVSVATLSGQAILDTLENQWKTEGDRPRLALGVSEGFTYTYDPAAPQGERIVDARLNGEPIDPATDYRVAASTFLFEGGDGLINPADVRDILLVGYMDTQALIDYLKNNESVAPRAAQSDVAVTVAEGELAAGETVTLDLASLSYSSEGETLAQSVTVTAGSETVTADVDNNFSAINTGLGEHGTATVKIAIPADATEIVITTDAGTEVVVPLGAATEQPGESDTKPGKKGNSSLSSLSSGSSLSSR